MKKDYLSRLKGMFFSPLMTIQALKKEKGYRQAFIFLIISSLIAGIISIILEIAKGNPLIEGMPIIIAVFVNIMMVMLFDMVIVFGFSGLFHALLKAFGNKKPYYQTFKPFAYITCFWILTAFIAGLNPYLPYIWILNMVIMVWMLVLIGTGLRHYIEMSSRKLFAAWMIVIVLLLILLYFTSDALIAAIPQAAV